MSRVRKAVRSSGGELELPTWSRDCDRETFPPKLLGAARPRDGSARRLNRDGLGAAGARDLVREICLGREDALGRAGRGCARM